MYIENNKTALQNLFAGEDIYLLKNEFLTPSTPPLSVSSQTTAMLSVKTQTTTEKTTDQANTTPSYYQPKQKVIILVTSLTPTDSELLSKILGAVKLDLQSVDIIELDKNQEIDLSQIFMQKSVNQLITFGIDLIKVKLDIKLIPYQTLEKQGTKFIYSDSLSDIQNDIPKKKALWGSLKEMF
jgi:DNA polymerase III psi subunit